MLICLCLFLEPKSRGGREITSKDRGDARGREGISSPSLPPPTRRPDSPGTLTNSMDQRNAGGDRNIRNASPPRIGPSLNIPSSDDNGGSNRHGREPSPVVEKCRRYNSPSPATNYRQPSLSPLSRSSRYRDDKRSRRKISPSLVRRGTYISSPLRNEKSSDKAGSPTTSRRRKGTPTPPRRSRLDAVNSPRRRKNALTPPHRGRYDPPLSRVERERVVSGDRSLDGINSSRRRKGTPTPPRRGGYASPPPPPGNNSVGSPGRRRENPSPSGNRHDPYPAVQEGSKRDLRREVSRERVASSRRKVTPTPPHISRYASPPPPPEKKNSSGSPRRRLTTPSPWRNRYHSPLAIRKGSKRDRRLDLSKDGIVDGRPKDSSTLPRRSRYASPPPPPEREKRSSLKTTPPSPRKGRYDSPPAVQEVVKRDHRREVSRERITDGRRRGTPIPPRRSRYASPLPSRIDRESRHRDPSEERVSSKRQRRDNSRGFDKYGNRRRQERRASPSSGERKMRNASPPARSSARDRSPFKDRRILRQSPTAPH